MTSPDPQDIDMDHEEPVATEAKRTRGPGTYSVYRWLESSGTWEKLAENVEASNRRGAVVAAVENPTADEAFGQFLVVRSDEAKVLTREKKVIPETIADDWK